jgi:hypothetical protein
VEAKKLAKTYICDTSLTSDIPVERVISAASVLYLSFRRMQASLLSASVRLRLTADGDNDQKGRREGCSTDLFSSVSISSATSGKGFAAFLAQK